MPLVHQGRGEGEGPHRDARVRRPRLKWESRAAISGPASAPWSWIPAAACWCSSAPTCPARGSFRKAGSTTARRRWPRRGARPRRRPAFPQKRCDCVGRYPDLLAYELPKAAQSPRTGMGQVQVPGSTSRRATWRRRSSVCRQANSAPRGGPPWRRAIAGAAPFRASALQEAGPLSQRAAAARADLAAPAACLPALASCSRIGSVCSNERQASVMLWPNVACCPGE